MPPDMGRRAAMGALGAGALAAGAGTWYYRSGRPVEPLKAVPVAVRPAGPNRIHMENSREGSTMWQPGADGTTPVTDIGHQIKGYASTTSVPTGGSVDFHISVAAARRMTVEIYRLGYYSGLRARKLTDSGTLAGVRQPEPERDEATGTITCPWTPTWTLHVPSDWTPGLHVAVFTTENGYRSLAPFAVRDAEPQGAFLVVLPFTTYQAYNQYPFDGAQGKSLYYGYASIGKYDSAAHGALEYTARARAVSFDRPYLTAGLPSEFIVDQNAVAWLEMVGYDVTYCSSVDLHDGTVDPRHYQAVIFSGHDEYYSAPMRNAVETGIAAGVNVAYLAANNIYWHVRFAPSADGRPDRIMVCYKGDRDPMADVSGPTTLWRLIRPEQAVLGVQYIAVVGGQSPLTVSAPEHWFWAGTGVKQGMTIPGVVAGEADAVFPDDTVPPGANQVLLSSSPFTTGAGLTRVQNTSLYQAPSGAWVFDAATFNWSAALTDHVITDPRIQRATANLFVKLGRRA